MQVSPTARALKECKARGWEAGVVERFNSYTKRKHDLFGVLDIIAATPEGVLGIQVTSGDNHASRVAKVLAEPRMAAWRSAGARVAVWSYALRGARGKRKTYQLREEIL